MNNNINLIIIFLIIFIVFLLLPKKNEHFDQRVDGATKEQCGVMCTKILGCNGFAYDAKNQKCYLSKDEITFRPIKKPFVNFYNRNFPRCNKLYVINDPYYNSRNNMLRNATYKCMKKENGPIEHVIYDDKEKRKVNVNNLSLEELSPYTFQRIEWNAAVPSNGMFGRAIDMNVPKLPDDEAPKETDRFLFYGSSEDIVKRPDIVNDNEFSGTRLVFDPTQDLDPKSSIKDAGIINLDTNLRLVTNPTESNSLNIMKQYDEEFVGQYLFPHKCSTNITKEDCMKQCLNNKNCVGTEWNPTKYIKVGKPNKYNIEEGICCPKIRIKKVIGRRRHNRKGHFYLKETVNRKYLQDGEILVGLNKDKKDYVVEDLQGRFSRWKNNSY
jgi:PAN domain